MKAGPGGNVWGRFNWTRISNRNRMRRQGVEILKGRRRLSLTNLQNSLAVN